MSVNMGMNLSIDISVRMGMSLSIDKSVSISTGLSIGPSVSMSMRLSGKCLCDSGQVAFYPIRCARSVQLL